MPYISPKAKIRELGVFPIILGTILGMFFGASSLYLVLKVGLTVSASIPVAVISVTLFKLFSKIGLRNATVLENNQKDLIYSTKHLISIKIICFFK